MAEQNSHGHARGLRATWGRAARKITDATGSLWAFAAALLIIVAWALTGLIFGFTDTWQLIINTGTTIVTFLMVFLVQHSQNRDTHALHAKLNELIAAAEGASNLLIQAERLDEAEMKELEAKFQSLRENRKSGKESRASTSVAEVTAPHEER